MFTARRCSATPVRGRDISRALSTIPDAGSASSSDPHPRPRRNPFRQRKRECTPSSDSGRLFVRPWDGIPSMPDAFAMVRGIERKYGKVKSFKLMRDSEVTTAYHPFIWAELKDPSNFKGTAVIQVPIPERDRHRPGGIGLDDLQGLLESPDPSEQEEVWRSVTEQMVAESQRTGVAKVFDVRIERSASEELVAQRLISMNRQLRVSNAFIKWGGFSSPTDANTPQLENTIRKSRIHVEEHKSYLAELVEQGSPNLDLVEEPEPQHEPKPFNYTFDEPVVVKAAKPVSQPQKQPREFATNVSTAKSIKEKQEQGIALTKRERTLMQAAQLARTPLLAKNEKLGPQVVNTKPVAADRVERPMEMPGEEKMETEEDKKGFQDRLWKLVGGKLF